MASSSVLTRFLVISDTHGFEFEGATGPLRQPVPKTDVVIHCGDITMIGGASSYKKCLKMLGGIQAELKLVIAANHDLDLDDTYFKSYFDEEIDDLEMLGKTHPNKLTTISNLAVVLDSQGKYADAEAMNRQTLVIREEMLGKTYLSTLTIMSNLAGVLSSQGKYADAEAMNRQTLEISEEVLGKTYPDTLTSVYCFAFLLQKR